MEETPKPWLFTLQLEHTPSPLDPEGAPIFYQALGTLVVAWGRLETHFLACIMAILATKETKDLSRKLPMAWDEREKIWKDAFRISSALKPYETAALDFLAEIKKVAEDRNMLIHGLWGRFNDDTPVSASLIMIRHKKGTKNGIDHWRGRINVNQIIEVSLKSDRLNIELQTLSTILSVERGPPPEGIYIP